MSRIYLSSDQIIALQEGAHLQDRESMEVQPTKEEFKKYMVEILCVDIGKDANGNMPPTHITSTQQTPCKTDDKGVYLSLDQQCDPDVYFTTMAWHDEGVFKCPYYHNANNYWKGQSFIEVQGHEEIKLRLKKVWVERMGDEFVWCCELKDAAKSPTV